MINLIIKNNKLISILSAPLSLSILTGFLLGTSTIPFPPWALFFCLSPLFYIWMNETPKKVFLYTTLSFTIGSLISLYWIEHLLAKFALMPWYASALTTLVFAVFYHIHLSFAGYLFTRFAMPFAKRPLLCASSIFALCWLTFPLLFPWNFSLGWLYGGLEGYQFADIIGSDGISTLTVFINALFLISFSKVKETKLHLAGTVCFLLVLNFAGSLYSRTLTTPDKSFNVVIGQANIGNIEDRYKKDRYNYRRTIIDDYLRVTKEGLEKASNPVDLIVWPETAFPEYFDYRFFGTEGARRLSAFAQEHNTNIITGAFAETSSGKTTNSALFFDRTGTLIGAPVYKKILLAFGEYMPFEETFPILRKWFPMVGNFERGKSAQTRKLDGGPAVGTQICYEGLFPSFSRELIDKGSQLMVNLTNDSWYGPHAEPLQHLYLSAFRVIENRTPLIRSTNTGVSTVILADGTFLEKSPLHKEWGGSFEVPYYSEQKKTIYQQWGYAIPLIMTLILFMVSFIYAKQEDED